MFNVLLYSSGIDSYISYYYLKKEKQINHFFLFYANLGHKYSKIEQMYIRKYRPETIILNVEKYGKIFEEYDAYIPNRNLLLCLLAVSYFEKATNNLTIYLGGLKDDRIYDNNPVSFQKFSECLSLGDIKVEIKSAFDFELSKKEIIDWYTKDVLYDDREFDLHTNCFSCYNPIETNKDPHCYACRACFRRCVALFDYVKLPFKDIDLLRKYYKDFKKNKDNYDNIRYEQTMKYFKYMLGI